MYQKEYNAMNEQLLPDGGLMEKVMEQAVPGRRRTFRPAAVMAAVFVAIMLAVPVMAAAMPWILEQIAPQLTERLEPVQRSVTSNGITMEVVGASVKGNQAELVVRIEGESLKNPVGVAPNLVTNREGLASGTYHAIRDYEGAAQDNANGIYYYQILMTYRDGISLEEILAGEMTVTLDTIWLSSSEFDNVRIPVTPVSTDQITTVKMKDLKEYGFNSFGCENIPECRHGCTMEHEVILPCEEMVYAVTEEMGVSCIAYIDGRLHIQMKMTTGSTYLESAFCAPYLVDAEGNEIRTLQGYRYAKDDFTNQLYYSEYSFAVSPEELDNYTIRLDYRYMIRPECEVTFHFTEAEVTVE